MRRAGAIPLRFLENGTIVISVLSISWSIYVVPLYHSRVVSKLGVLAPHPWGVLAYRMSTKTTLWLFNLLIFKSWEHTLITWTALTGSWCSLQNLRGWKKEMSVQHTMFHQLHPYVSLFVSYLCSLLPIGHGITVGKYAHEHVLSTG